MKSKYLKNSFNNRKIEKKPSKQKAKKTVCYLGNKYPDIYFTRRETQCMREFLQGKTNQEAAQALNLSVRTVENYLSAMRNKLQCRSKKELIQKVRDCGFLKEIEDI